jgi:hypothetical protein
MHAHVLLLLPTPILHSYVTEEKKRQERKTEKKDKKGKEKKKEKTDGRIKRKEDGRTYVRFVVFARSVPCRALYCGVALGATTTRSIVVALRFSHHHQQQAAATTATTAVIASERERERDAPIRVYV